MLSGGRNYSSLQLSSLEIAATEWLDGFYQLEHLLCTRKWVVQLRPHASSELLFAALVHDAERYFPGGPTSTPQNGFDDPEYLFAHSIRSADIVQAWLEERPERHSEEWTRTVRRLILRHELGGNEEEDVLQAADSLAFLDALDWLAVEWVCTGHYSVAGAKEKLTWAVERLRPPAAVSFALPLYVRAVQDLETARKENFDFAARRRFASSRSALLSRSDSAGNRESGNV